MIRLPSPRTLILLALILLAMAIAGGMDKADAAPFSPRAEAFYAEGLAYWRLPVPASCPVVTRELVATDELALHEAGQLGEYADCTIRVAAVLEEYPACEEREMVFHEVGHLVGLQHTTDPTGYMTPDNGWQMCREWRAAWRAAHPHTRRGATIHAPFRKHRDLP